MCMPQGHMSLQVRTPAYQACWDDDVDLPVV